MKVKDMLEYLARCPPDMEVFIDAIDYEFVYDLESPILTISDVGVLPETRSGQSVTFERFELVYGVQTYENIRRAVILTTEKRAYVYEVNPTNRPVTR